VRTHPSASRRRISAGRSGSAGGSAHTLVGDATHPELTPLPPLAAPAPARRTADPRRASKSVTRACRANIMARLIASAVRAEATQIRGGPDVDTVDLQGRRWVVRRVDITPTTVTARERSRRLDRRIPDYVIGIPRQRARSAVRDGERDPSRLPPVTDEVAGRGWRSAALSGRHVRPWGLTRSYRACQRIPVKNARAGKWLDLQKRTTYAVPGSGDLGCAARCGVW